MIKITKKQIESFGDDDPVQRCPYEKQPPNKTPYPDCGEIKCFTPPKGADLDEFERQLKEQQDIINKTDPKELGERIDTYKVEGRPPDDAKRRADARSAYFNKQKAKKIRECKKEKGSEDYNKNADHYNKMIDAEIKKEMSTLSATHGLDLVAGGDGSVSGLGDRKVNASLGAQWKGGRVDQLREHARRAQETGESMNVVLRVCP